jgi:hypothetical protein
MISKKGKFYGGFALLIGFTVVLIILFSPIFKGHNALQYLDALYNSISKGSAYYIPAVTKESQGMMGNRVGVTLKVGDRKQAEQTAALFTSGGAEAVLDGSALRVAGDLGKILENCLYDSDAMYKNKGSEVFKKYGYDEKRALYNWWQALKAMDRDLKRQKKFKEAGVVTLVIKKAVETSYNYYKIEPQKVTDRLGTVLFSLFFYVAYTLWYGFAILFMFEGWGLRLGH